MKLKLTALALISSLFLISCGASKAKTQCMDAIKKSQETYKKSAGKDMPADMVKKQEAACANL